MTAQLFGWEKQVELLSGVSISSWQYDEAYYSIRRKTLSFGSPTTLGLSFIRNHLLFGIGIEYLQKIDKVEFSKREIDESLQIIEMGTIEFKDISHNIGYNGTAGVNVPLGAYIDAQFFCGIKTDIQFLMVSYFDHERLGETRESDVRVGIKSGVRILIGNGPFQFISKFSYDPDITPTKDYLGHAIGRFTNYGFQIGVGKKF
jgi:hypothetical protein